MGNRARRAPYFGLWVFALTFGWIEAASVVYLREIYLREVNYVGSFQFPVLSIPGHLVFVEVVREACTLLLLGTVAWLAGRRWADRIGAFLLVFGAWDLAYYGALRLVLEWPVSLTTWDILFLIPLPWVAPVWAPTTVAGVFVVVGSYLFWTAERPREYSRKDIGILLASALVIIAAFLVEWRVVLDRQVPQQFPVWLFWTGVVSGTFWFVRVERRAAANRSTGTPWVGVRVRTILPGSPKAGPELIPARSVEDGVSVGQGEADLGRLSSEYEAAKQRLDPLLKEAAAVGGRLERLGHALAAHPTRMIVEPSDQYIDDSGRWDVVTSQSLPTIGTLITLTDGIRDAAARVSDLRERLILLGRQDLVREPEGFFQ